MTLTHNSTGAPIILAHAGISDLAWLGSLIGNHPNLFFDTAWWNPTDLLALFSLVPPGQILHGSDAPYGDVELNHVITLRCGLAAGLSPERLALVTGGQLERLLQGVSPAPAGPAPGARLHASRPSDARVAAFLTAAGGALLGGGDPREMLELALLAIEPSDAGTPPGEDDLIHELLEAIDLTQPTATRNALVLALTLSATPGVRARHRSGIGVPRRSVGESDRIRSGIETANPIQRPPLPANAQIEPRKEPHARDSPTPAH